MTRGYPGVQTLERWAEMLEEAGDTLGNGRFLVQQLGAGHYLDPRMVAVLILLRQSLLAERERPTAADIMLADSAVLVTLRQNLLTERERPTAADIMLADSAVLAYYNMVRTQHWIGNLSLGVESELFGQAPLHQVHGPTVGARVRAELSELGEVMLPLQDRVQKMMVRSLDRLRP